MYANFTVAGVLAEISSVYRWWIVSQLDILRIPCILRGLDFGARSLQVERRAGRLGLLSSHSVVPLGDVFHGVARWKQLGLLTMVS